ncbi:hypothetical protein [Aquimarina sp. RZ0]|uniref:hypothetical protein n=1 Tax=Aquimarina sp. RZ0 TaxID=2607730 RepID=UPI00165F8D57|nr:hypothetical protein [Aquimarina sp. RZ0]
MCIIKENMIDHFLIKYLSGNTTETETTHMENWIAQSTDNKLYYETIHKLWVNRIVL